MAVNQATLELIREFEGFIPNWYPDPAHGWKVPTCCIGHTDAAGEPFYADTKNKKFSQEEGLIILSRDLKKVEEQVKALVAVPLNENQYGALVSFVFNLGAGNFSSSTLLRKLNKRDYAGAATEFGRWINAGGKPMNGLIRRREAERVLFLTSADMPMPTPAKPLPTFPTPVTTKPKTLQSWLEGLVVRKVADTISHKLKDIPQMQNIVAGLIRHGLTTFGGGLLSTGLIGDNEIGLIAGAVATLVGVAWSIIEKRLKA